MLLQSPYTMTIHGLNPANRYDFTFYSSISATDGSTRGTGYTIGGINVGMEVTNNVTTLLLFLMLFQIVREMLSLTLVCLAQITQMYII